MAHIAMVSIPAHGHVNPSVDLLRTLAARGHRVTYANDPSFLDAVKDVGASLKPYASTLPGPPRALQPHAERVDPSVYQFVGPALGNRGVWNRPVSADKVLLVSLGSAFTRHADFYRRCIAAFGDLAGWHIVLQIGRHVDVAELGAVPDSVEVHPWVPQLAVLEQADAFLTHAGMGGSSEGLYCGTPMIAVPQAADQFDNADRLVELGVATRLDLETVTADDLRAELVRLTSDAGVAARCAELRRQVRGEGGADRAADLVEAQLPVRS